MRRFYITNRKRGRLVRADYEGGPYIELTFGSEGYHPTEVINVWDYEAGEPTIDLENVREEVRREVREWIADNDRDWPEWYTEYLANR